MTGVMHDFNRESEISSNELDLHRDAIKRAGSLRTQSDNSKDWLPQGCRQIGQRRHQNSAAVDKNCNPPRMLWRLQLLREVTQSLA
jgi:hypothetical protein